MFLCIEVPIPIWVTFGCVDTLPTSEWQSEVLLFFLSDIGFASDDFFQRWIAPFGCRTRPSDNNSVADWTRMNLSDPFSVL